MPNLHSHAFQRGMAGLAETRGPGADSFWSWRNVMYRFALSMTPDHVEAVAGQLYMEMLEAGFSRVGEFHYLHHDIDGSALCRHLRDGAADRRGGVADGHRPDAASGLLCAFDFGGAAPNEGQRRFINTLESFERLLDGCQVGGQGFAGWHASASRRTACGR